VSDPELATRVFSEIGFVSGIMAAFALAIVVPLITSNDWRKRTSITLVSLLISSAAFLVSTFSSSLVRIGGARLGDKPGPEVFESLQDLAGISFYIALLALLFGLGAVGWLRSRSTGIFSSVIAFVSLVAIIGAVLLLSEVSLP
jgi:hypothetical protein